MDTTVDTTVDPQLITTKKNYLSQFAEKPLQHAVSYHLTHSLTLIRRHNVKETPTSQGSCFLHQNL